MPDTQVAQSDPQKNLNNFINQWWQESKQYTADYGYLTQMLQQMMAMAKSGNIEGAFQVAQMNVMPSAMTVQGDTIGKLAAGMNIGSAYQEFTTASQNGVTNDPQEGNVANFIKFLQEFYNDINNGRTPMPWMSSATRNQLNAAIEKICKLFGVDNPNELNPITVATDIYNWTNGPMEKTGNGKTGQENMQDLQAGFTQWNNVESAQSQGLQAQEQFASNTFNQYLNACLDIFKSSQGQIGAMVRNQKSQ